jgi:hypothetical protein
MFMFIPYIKHSAFSLFCFLRLLFSRVLLGARSRDEDEGEMVAIPAAAFSTCHFSPPLSWPDVF